MSDDDIDRDVFRAAFCLMVAFAPGLYAWSNADLYTFLIQMGGFPIFLAGVFVAQAFLNRHPPNGLGPRRYGILGPYDDDRLTWFRNYILAVSYAVFSIPIAALLKSLFW